MPYRVLADITVLAHFGWIVFLVIGGIWGRRIRWVRAAHVGGLVFALALSVSGWYCPLTYLEVWLRGMHEPGAAYAGSFVGHYLERLIYLPLPNWGLTGLTVVLCLFNLWVYLGRGGRRARGQDAAV